MATILCPKCGRKAIGGTGFWGRRKPYCTACGWNVAAARDLQRRSLRVYLWGLPLIAGFVVLVGFAEKHDVLDIAVPLLFLFIVLAGTFFAWRRLKRLDDLNASAARGYPLSAPAPQNPKLRELPPDSTQIHQEWLRLSKPRRVRFKCVPAFLLIAFPVALILTFAFCLQFVFDALRESRPLGAVMRLLVFFLVLSAIAIPTIRNSLRDRKVMAEGDLAIGKVTSQGSTDGRRPKSKIRYEFKDGAGRLIEGEGSDDTWEIYEDLEVLVFYQTDNPGINIPICGATCELRAD
jgi:hypothetical protein